MSDLSYPIGRFSFQAESAPALRAGWIDEAAAAPGLLRQAVAGLSDLQLDTPYRPEGWTVRQVVHHLADSHMNSVIRFRLALTEEHPTIKPYNEKAWANLSDARTGPVEPSLTLFDAMHQRWTALLRSMSSADFARTFRHPDHPETAMTLDRTLALYVWHGKHHTAHITSLRQRMGW